MLREPATTDASLLATWLAHGWAAISWSSSRRANGASSKPWSTDHRNAWSLRTVRVSLMISSSFRLPTIVAPSPVRAVAATSGEVDDGSSGGMPVGGVGGVGGGDVDADRACFEVMELALAPDEGARGGGQAHEPIVTVMRSNAAVGGVRAHDGGAVGAERRE